MLEKYHFDHIHEDCRIKCPDCSDQRKNKTAKTLSVTRQGNEYLYYCHDCHLSGKHIKKQDIIQPNVRAISVPQTFDESKVSRFLRDRNINPEHVNKYPVISGKKFFNGCGEVDSIGFVYGDKEAVKWRSIEGKHFTQDGAARTFWRIEDVDDSEIIVIVEGEADCLATACAGVNNVVSVPNGAPVKVSARTIDPEEDVKFHYVWEARTTLEQKQKVILACDNDRAGFALQEELARRIGRAKCWTIEYPDGCKDPNDILIQKGEDELKRIFDNAQPIPLEGVYSANEYSLDIEHLYKEGMVGGVSTGLSTLDNLFTVVPDQLTIITGIPGSGKSEFVDQLMVNLAKREKWKFAVASFENPPPLHIAKLCEKYVKKPFFDGNQERMTEEEREEAGKWVNEHFLFLEQRGGDTATIESILDRAKQAVMRLGVRGLVIDPYNYIAQSSGTESEHKGINDMLTRLVTFARAHKVHIWFVAHPAKMMTNSDGSTPVPKGMNISGSAAFFAKADLGITVHLDSEKNVEIHCWKARFKWVGKTGYVNLDFDIPTGTYSDIEYPDFDPDVNENTTKNFTEVDDDWDF